MEVMAIIAQASAIVGRLVTELAKIWSDAPTLTPAEARARVAQLWLDVDADKAAENAEHARLRAERNG